MVVQDWILFQDTGALPPDHEMFIELMKLAIRVCDIKLFAHCFLIWEEETSSISSEDEENVYESEDDIYIEASSSGSEEDVYIEASSSEEDVYESEEGQGSE